MKFSEVKLPQAVQMVPNESESNRIKNDLLYSAVVICCLQSQHDNDVLKETAQKPFRLCTSKYVVFLINYCFHSENILQSQYTNY